MKSVRSIPFQSPKVSNCAPESLMCLRMAMVSPNISENFQGLPLTLPISDVPHRVHCDCLNEARGTRYIVSDVESKVGQITDCDGGTLNQYEHSERVWTA